jgi:hypothetical protein
MTELAEPRRRKRPWMLFIIWGLLALVLAGWTGWWFVLRANAASQIDAWMAGERAKGAEASYTRVSASGFPLRLTLTYDGLAYGAAGGAWKVSTPKAQVHINPSDLSLFLIEPRDTVMYATRGATRAFTPKESLISIHVVNGKADRVVIEGKNVAVVRNNAPEMQVESFVAGVRPDPRAPSDGQLSFDATNLTLVSPPKGFEAFGGQLQSLNARIVFEKGGRLIEPGADGLRLWAQDNGAARIEGLGFVWGPAKITSTGRYTIDAQRRLAGILDLSLEKPSEAFAALSQSPAISPDLARVYQMMAVANAVKGGPLKAPLVIENGVMSFADLPLRTVEPIQ